MNIKRLFNRKKEYVEASVKGLGKVRTFDPDKFVTTGRLHK